MTDRTALSYWWHNPQKRLVLVF